MQVEFRNGIQVLRAHEAKPRLTTGILELDSLLAGGVELGTFNLFYGDNERFTDRILYNLLCNCQLPRERFGFDGKVILLNCGNYRQEQALLDLELATSLLKANGLDPARGLDQIIAVSAFNIDQAAQAVEEACNIVNNDDQVRLLVARNLAKLFIEDGVRSKETLARIQQLQHLVGRLWQACSAREVSLVASCRPRRANTIRPSPSEGGVFIRHLAQVMVCFRKKEESGTLLAYLLKHPRRKAGMAEFSLAHGDSVLGRLTIPFRSQLQQQIENLTRSFREALMEPARRDAFDSLVRAWTAEQGAMSYAKGPSVLEVMHDADSYLEDVKAQYSFEKMDFKKKGTKLILTKLRKKWTYADVEKVRYGLTRLIPPTGSPSDFSIVLEVPDYPSLEGIIRSNIIDRAPFRITANLQYGEVTAMIRCNLSWDSSRHKSCRCSVYQHHHMDRDSETCPWSL